MQYLKKLQFPKTGHSCNNKNELTVTVTSHSADGRPYLSLILAITTDEVVPFGGDAKFMQWCKLSEG